MDCLLWMMDVRSSVHHCALLCTSEGFLQSPAAGLCFISKYSRPVSSVDSFLAGISWPSTQEVIELSCTVQLAGEVDCRRDARQQLINQSSCRQAHFPVNNVLTREPIYECSCSFHAIDELMPRIRGSGQAVHSDIEYSDKGRGQTVALLLSLGEHFSPLFFIFAIFLIVPEKMPRALLSQVGANCKAFWVESAYTLGLWSVFKTVSEIGKSVLKTLQLGGFALWIIYALERDFGTTELLVHLNIGDTHSDDAQPLNFKLCRLEWE